MGLYTYAFVPASEYPEVLWPIYAARILAWELAISGAFPVEGIK